MLRQQVRSFNQPEETGVWLPKLTYWAHLIREVRGKKRPLSSAGLQGLRSEHTRTIEPSRATAAGILTLERALSELVNQASGLTPAEIELMWQTAPPRMPIPAPAS